ncbi:MAG: PAS domain-containing protein [Comamonadaceae bacterium]|nr:PAS domain-containing protein [Comamonadaceae bacterium]
MTDKFVDGVTHFPIVGMGASAGGLEAFEAFFRACPANTGMGFVLVPHLDPGHESLLTEILQRCTAMPVVEALDQVAVVPNQVFIIPPNREMGILNGVLQLHLPQQPRGQRLPIDGFLRALAEDQAERAIGIILSGNASDGTLGLRAIFGAGGACLVQDPSSAGYDGMPQSAITAGYATHILPVEDMPAMLLQLNRQSAYRLSLPGTQPEKAISGINQILLQLRNATGHDFSLYKKNTTGRRIERRMAQHTIDDLAVYARFLRENPTEIQALFKELLINVTSFFRDPEAFIALKTSILPPLLAVKPAGAVFRVWVAGCASGEEAYSIAMVLQELQDEAALTHPPTWGYQIFATDLDDDAIATARAGNYPPNIAQDVTPERLQHFFTKDPDERGGFKVKKSLREKVVFAVHSVIKDPPFTKLDCLSCRNLLIYLESELQEQLVPSFHYALNPDGVLFLSSSESITHHPELFAPLDRKWKFYRAKATAPRSVSLIRHDLNWTFMQAIDTSVHVAAGNPATKGVAELAQRALLQAFAPTSVTTDRHGNILYVHGDASNFLRPPPGLISTQVVEMAHPGLQLELRAALLAAATLAKPTLNREVTLPGDDGSGKRTVSFSVRPLPGQAADGENLLLVSFQDLPAASAARHPPGQGDAAPTSAEAVRIGELEREVDYARENLQSTIEAQQASNEELKSANEELQSTNEELQSTNEELETSKEELQSLNEEVLTVNSELNAKVEQLSGIQNDMKNLFDNIHTGTLFLDHQLTIRRYTREALKIYPLIAGDIGRPLADIQSNFDSQSLLVELQAVLDTLVPQEREVRTFDGKWYLARIQPYRTLDNVIEGVVLTFTEVTDFKRLSDAVRRNEAILATAQEIAHLGSWELDLDSGMAHWSDEMFKLFGYPASSQPMALDDVLITLNADDRARVVAEMHNAVAHHTPYDITYRITRLDGTQREIRARALPVADASGRITHLVGTSLDVTP